MMALRRNRIKGIVANVCNQRRKNVNDINIKSEIFETSEAQDVTRDPIKKGDQDKIISPDEKCQSESSSDKNLESAPNLSIERVENFDEASSQRNIIKIPESINVSYKCEDSDGNKHQEDNQREYPKENRVCDENVSTDESSQTNGKQKVSFSTVSGESVYTLDETVLLPISNSFSHLEGAKASGKEKPSDKPIQLVSNTVNSDTEYPPPLSPSKINRTRIKAVPRFGKRKASYSASESEDESRKHRIRNDSVCSSTSVVADSVGECMSPQRQKEVTASTVSKKCNRSEQTRKLAEARREFQRRFGTNVPDRKKLRMMDLIFYNPVSNRIVNEKKSEEENTKIEDKTPNDPTDEDVIVEDTRVQKDSEKSDDEDAIPVPQIKIGPSGEIVLDEKSLVIENKEVKRQKEEMQKTKILDGDLDYGYGIYKKHKRSKNWTHEETVRFYKALNIIGTDFTLMCELFPNRSRRELKMKFKKEERTNKMLLNRAVMQPCSFEFDELKNEAATEERQMEEMKKLREDAKKRRAEESKLKQEELAEKAKKRKAVPTENLRIIKLPKTKQKKKKKSKKVELDIDAYVNENDADESDIGPRSESDEEIVIPQGPTRSGRMPKVTKKYENELCTIENLMLKNKVPDNIKPTDVEPGSIMIINEMGPNGEPIYKIFMVTPDHTATPLNISSDKVTEAIQLKKGMSAQNIVTISENVTDDEVEIPLENNLTIPADGTITNLKTKLLKGESVSLTSENELVQVNKDIISEYESDSSVPPGGTRTTSENVSCTRNYVVMNSEN
ncbi:transcription factor TFIIIB component B'' homolog Bdp1 isoform X1 [Leptinotarsa decemlineata]|uniref:transcription factor TFIIIB component B'' homolog Bdp1 isoform X1 n=1 Tax=Leptinotarsa decemlineata TaxID=7539 RepID=UPI003D307C93